MSLKLEPGSLYTIEELTEIYNSTRVDYLVPMPMSPEVLAEYVHDFDVDLELSVVAKDMDSSQILGLGMLGTRGGRGWVTRLGVLPDIRRKGAGRAIFDHMIASAVQKGYKSVVLEVIKNNTPAHKLFLSRGFRETREYLVMRRAPIRITKEPEGKLTWLYRKDALSKLSEYPQYLTWINDIASMANASNLQGFELDLENGGSGWLIYRHKKFTLSHLVFHTESGEPVEVARNLLMYLHRQYHRQDTYAENFFLDDPHLPALLDLGYFEAFRRIEMILDL